MRSFPPVLMAVVVIAASCSGASDQVRSGPGLGAQRAVAEQVAERSEPERGLDYEERVWQQRIEAAFEPSDCAGGPEHVIPGGDTVWSYDRRVGLRLVDYGRAFTGGLEPAVRDLVAHENAERLMARGSAPAPVDADACRGAEMTTLALDVSDLDVSDIVVILPLGNLNPPGHTHPTDHICHGLPWDESGRQLLVDVRAPGDGRVTSIDVSTADRAGVVTSDHSIRVELCRDWSLKVGPLDVRELVDPDTILVAAAGGL